MARAMAASAVGWQDRLIGSFSSPITTVPPSTRSTAPARTRYLVDAHERRPHRLGHIVQPRVEGQPTRIGHAGDLPPVGVEIADGLFRDAEQAVRIAAQEHLVCLVKLRRERTGEHIADLLGLGRLHHIAERADRVPVEHKIRVAGDEYELQGVAPLPQGLGGFHAVQAAHLDIQEYEIDLTRVLFHPAEQPLARGKFIDLALDRALVQQALKHSAQAEPRLR